MELPPHIDPEEFQSAILRIMQRIKKKYKYTIHDGDDLAQEAYFIAVDICVSYNPDAGPLYNFLSVSVNNRIKNFIRNKSYREIICTSLSNVEEETIKIGNMKTSSDEFWDIVDEHLSPEYRADYLKSRQGIYLPKMRRIKLITELKRIINDCL